MINYKAQAWGIDLMVALGIFSTVIFVFFIYSINQTGSATEILKDLQYDARIISNSILSQGYPENWNSNDVMEIGILNNNKINETKLQYFYDLSQEDYQRTRILFKTKYNYLFVLSENMTINSQSIEGVGKPGTTKDNLNPKNLIKLTRHTIYKEKPIIAYLYVWEE